MKSLLHVSLIGCALLLAACNTVKGMGQDIQKAGEKIENAAQKK